MIIRLAILAVVLSTGVTRAQTVTATVTAGTNPYSVAVNPVTNKIYVVNQGSNNVTVIDGATNNTATVAVGTEPLAVAVNPLTNQIYVANNSSPGTVTVIDGATNNTTTVPVDPYPTSIAVNPVTNQIYVANAADVTVIDGATNNTIAVPAGKTPATIAVNPVTNQIYVTNSASNTVTVINGANNSTATVAVGANPYALAVNLVTNQIYVANDSSPGSVTVINGVDNSTATVAVGTNPYSVAANPVTNQIYVANDNSAGTVTVINGANNSTATVAVGTNPYSVAVDSVTNRIYVANDGSGNLTVIDGATNNTTTLTAGSNPLAVAVNPVTNKIYVSNYFSANVTAIDGATDGTAIVSAGLTSGVAVALNPVTNQIYVASDGRSSYQTGFLTVIDGVSNSPTATVGTGVSPVAVVASPVTNQIYVANAASSTVTVIDGVTRNATTVAVGAQPQAVALNPVTDQIYVANGGDGTVTVIDGATNSTTTVPIGGFPASLAVNPVTNKIYVAGTNLTVIDGATNNTTSVLVGSNPSAVAVNPVTNLIYVANANSSSVTVIDGATNNTTTVPVGSSPDAVAVNQATNQIYVANGGSASVTVIDGVTNSTTTVPAGAFPISLVVDQATNKIYVGNNSGGTVTIIDGATNITTAVGPAGYSPVSLAANPVTNQIYVVNSNDTVTVITEEQVQAIPPTTAITPLLNNQTNSPTPSFTFSAQSNNATVPDGLYFQVDTWQKAWSVAPGSNSYYTGTLASLQPGFHILYAYAGDGQEATSTQPVSPLTGAIQAYGFLVTQPPTTVATSVPGSAITVDGVSYTSPQTFTWTIGSVHTISVNSPQAGPAGVQYVFAQWSDGTTNSSDTITVPNGGGVYTANFNPQYLLTTAVNPAAGGTVTGGGYYAADSLVPVTATPAAGYAFGSWTGAVANSASASTTVGMSGPETVTANFLVLQSVAFGVISTQSVGTTLSLNATASSGLPVSFSSSTTNICTVSGSTATLVAAGVCSIQAAQFGNAIYAPATPVTQTFNVIASGATYVGYDTATQGNWGGSYGADGYSIAALPPNAPGYATVSLGGGNTYVWSRITSDPRALQIPAPTLEVRPENAAGRIASTYYSAGGFNISVSITDGNAHRLALYLLDWDSTARAETISITDAHSGAVLDTETFSGFHNGEYVSWNIQGDVAVQVTKTGGGNAVVSGIFFDPIPALTAAASYSGRDAATQGAWTGFYGGDGQLIANDGNNLPGYASVSGTGDSLWTWSSSTSDPRAPETASGSTSLIASAYYSSSFTFNVNLTDGNAHRVSLYLLDWDTAARAETISILDATTSKVLDMETFANFHGGQYATWTVQGHVLIQVKQTGGANAVVSGIFFDPPAASGTAAAYSTTDTTTQGLWTGVYGSSGYAIANEASSLPAFAAVRLTGDSLYTWASPATGPRPLQTASAAATQIASTYYAGGSFSIDLNLTDGNNHKISLYLLDWDSTARAETISILNAENNTLLDTETYASFHNGEYAVWEIQGHVVIQVTRTGGGNAVVSGIFID